MKTTLDLPDEILHRAKVVAAQRKTTLKALVTQGLEHVTAQDLADRQTSRVQALFAAMDELPRFSASDRLTRDEIHER